MNAVLYARYSSDNQREESIDAQIRAGREYCKKKEYALIREYCDEAFSGTNDDRPAYQRMIDDAKSGLFDIIIFHKIDRNARNEYDYYFNKMKLEKFGIRIEYSSQHIDDSAEGKLLESVMVGVAAYHSRNLAKEVMKGMKENVYKGLFNGGVPPLGYKIVDQKYVIDEREAAAVRMIFDMYLKGHGYTAIVNELNLSGYKTRRGNSFGKNSLYDILSNIRYAGYYTYGKNQNKTSNGKRNQHGTPGENYMIVEDIIPVIISKNDYVRVKEKMEQNKRKSAKYTAKRQYLLAGLVHCGLCGSIMHGKTTSSKPGAPEYQYYYCGTKNRKGAAACNSTNIDLTDLENLVIRKIDDVLFSPNTIHKLVEKITEGYIKRTATIGVEKSALLKEQTKIAKRMDMLYTQIEEGLADEYDLQRLKKVKTEMTAIREKLAVLADNPNVFLTEEQVCTVIDSYRAAIKTKSAENLRALIENFINKIVISKDEIVIEFKINFQDAKPAKEKDFSMDGFPLPAPREFKASRHLL